MITAEAPHASPRMRLVSFWLGIAEILLGTLLAYIGCRHGWAADDRFRMDVIIDASAIVEERSGS